MPHQPCAFPGAKAPTRRHLGACPCFVLQGIVCRISRTVNLLAVLVSQVLLDQPLLAMCVSAHHIAWRVDGMVARAGGALGSADGGGNATFACGNDGSPHVICSWPPADAPARRPWARGPVDRVGKLWHRCLAIARAEEVLRAKRQGGSQESHRSERQQQQQQQAKEMPQAAGGQLQQPQQQSEGLRQPPPRPLPRLIEARGAHVTYDKILQLYDKLQRRWMCGVLGPGTAAASTLHGIRATVRRLAELGFLEEPGSGAGLPAAEVHERISKAGEILRERIAALRLMCSRPAFGGPAAGSGGDSDSVMTNLLFARVAAFSPVDLPDELLKAENAVGAGGLVELRARLFGLRRAPNGAPVRAQALMQLARELNIGVLAAHPHTWMAALQQLADLERQQEREQAEGTVGGGQGVAGAQGDQEEQRRARDAKADALRVGVATARVLVAPLCM